MKFYRHLKTASALSALVIIPACADEGTSVPNDGPGFAIEIAPVTYDGAVNVCYGIHVANADGDTVVLLQDICSDTYGNGAGGDLAYVAPCDASGTGSSTVTLWLESIEIDANGNTEPESEYINPCGLEADLIDDEALVNGWNDDGFYCTRTIQCLPNADVRVAFDITVMRDAQQGFFDIVVDFEDIFCSAKADTCYRDRTGISLLLDQDDPVGETPRDSTAVMALACSAGPDTANPEGDISTTLHFSNVGLTCSSAAGTVIIPFDMAAGESGLAGNQAAKEYFTPSANGPVGPLQLASPVNFGLYWGAESLPCGEADLDDDDVLDPLSCNKKYWNIAVNLEDLRELGFTDCSLQAIATATGSDSLQLVNGGLDGEGVVYPVINFNEQILANNAPTCDWNPLNGTNSTQGASAVQTSYVGTGDTNTNVLSQLFCYNKNSTEDGKPWYTKFVDRYTDADKGRVVGSVPRSTEVKIGGRIGKGCYKTTQTTAVYNTSETVVWIANADTLGLTIQASARNEADIAAMAGYSVAFYGYSKQSWGIIATQGINTLADLRDRKTINNNAERYALVITDKADTAELREIERTYIIDTGVVGAIQGE